jgi:hypothetical protein
METNKQTSDLKKIGRLNTCDKIADNIEHILILSGNRKAYPTIIKTH